MVHADDASEIVKSLTEKLSAALVNVSAKEELVKQHAKVAEEAVAGMTGSEDSIASIFFAERVLKLTKTEICYFRD